MLSRFNRLLWDPFLLIVLCGAGIYFTILFRFVQVRRFGAAWRQALSRKSGGPGVSPFQALAAAVSAQIGAGNLAGAAAAISAGGPGAVFWMWASAFFGMASAYAEALMAQKYNVRRRGQVVGGPAYYIQAAFPGLAGRCLAGVFALLMVFALGFIGAMVQANTIGESFGEAFGLPPLSAGLATAALCLPVFLGGMERMASFSAKLAPIMTGLYLLGAFFALASRRQLKAFYWALFARRPWPEGWPALRSKKPSAWAYPEGSSPMKQAWVPPPTLTRWPGRTIQPSRVMWPCWGSLSIRLSCSPSLPW